MSPLGSIASQQRVLPSLQSAHLNTNLFNDTDATANIVHSLAIATLSALGRHGLTGFLESL